MGPNIDRGRMHIVVGLVVTVGIAMLMWTAVAPASAVQPGSIAHTFGRGGHCGVIIAHENAGDNAIQLALNAAAGGKISPAVVCVGPGVYPEQLSITSSGISLVGLGTPRNPTVIEPSSVAANNYANNTNWYPDGTADAAIILVSNGGAGGDLGGVNLVNLVIDGAAASSSWNVFPADSCWFTAPFVMPDFTGVMFTGASGSIVGSTITDVYLPVDQAACEMGQAIDVGLEAVGATTTETVLIANDVISNYNDAAVWCYASGATCNILGNDMQAYAPYQSIATAPGGIDIFPGVTGTVEMNVVSGNNCTNLAAPCGPNIITQFQGIGLWTLYPAAGTIIKDNVFFDNNVGVLALGDSATIRHNVFIESTYDAIVVYDGAGNNTISGNAIINSPTGILVLNDGYGPLTSFNVSVFSSAFYHVPVLLNLSTMSPAGATTVYLLGHAYTASGTQTILVTGRC